MPTQLYPANSRTLRDNTLYYSATMPVAANTVNTTGIDMMAIAPFTNASKFNVKISSTESAGTANTKNVDIRLMDSADNVTYANLANVANPVLQVTDAAGTTAAGEVQIILPPVTRRYIRATATGEADGGDASDATFSIELLGP